MIFGEINKKSVLAKEIANLHILWNIVDSVF